MPPLSFLRQLDPSYLDDMADPTDEIDQMIRQLTGQGGRTSAVPALPAEEEESALASLGGNALTALQYVGETLDKPGAAVRGLLAGKPEALLNLVPFSDAMGITDPQKRTSGRDLAEQWGWMDKNTPGLDWGDIGGFGIDVLTDPLTYATLGASALTKAGRAAKAVGVLPKAEIGAVATEGFFKGRPILQRGAREAGMQSTLRDVLKTPDLIEAAERYAKTSGFDLANEMDDPLRGLIGIGLPFSEPIFTIGHGKAAQKIARGLDFTGHTLRYSGPGRALANKFAPASQEAKSAAGQIDLEEAFAGKTLGESEALTGGALDYQLLQRHGLDDKDARAVLRQMAERTHVGAAPEVAQRNADDVLNFHFRNDPKLSKLAPEAQAEVGGMIKRRWTEADNMLREAEEAGLDIADLAKSDPTVAYWHRVRTRGATETAGTAGRIAGLNADQLLAREGMFKNIAPTEQFPGGTGTLEAIAQDPMLSGPHRNPLGLTPESLTEVTPAGVARRSPKQAAAFGGGRTYLDVPPTYKETTTLDDAARKIFEEHLGKGQQGTQQLAELRQLQDAAKQGGQALDEASDATLQALETADAQSKELAKWAAGLDPRHAAEKYPVFGNSIVDDATAAKLSHVQVVNNAKAVTSMFARAGELGGGGLLSLEDALVKAGFRREKAVQNVAQKMLEMGNKSVDPAVLKKLAAGIPEGLEGDALKAAKDSWSDAAEALREVKVPDQVVADALRARGLMTNPKEQTWFGKVFDSYLNTTKAWLTSAWPGFHFRNDANGFWQQMMTSSFDPRYGRLNPLAWWKPQQDALTILGGETLKGASEIPGLGHLSDKQATEALAAMAWGQHTGTHFTQTGELVGKAGELPPSNMAGIPGQVPIRYRDVAKNLKPDAISDVLKFGGVRGQTFTKAGRAATETGRDIHPVIRAGRTLGDITERKHQLATLIAQLRQGKSADVAGAIARAAHVDYRLNTQFERSVMKRLFPFYQYTSRMIPWQIRRLMEKPGGLSAQAIRGVNETRDDQGFLPPQIARSLAIPIGEKVPGQMTYLGGFDLPHEILNDVLKMNKSGSPSAGQTGLALLSQTNPLFRAPLEWMFQKQAMSGRDIPDLDSRIGRLIATAQGKDLPPDVPNWIDQLVGASPASRVLNTAGQIIDPRKTTAQKAANLLTGARFTTVDVDKAKQRAAMDAVNELLRDTQGVRFFENMSVDPDQLATMTPQEVELIRLNKTIESRRRKRAKELAK